MNHVKNVSLTVICGTLILLLSACGQMGPLYLPQSSSKALQGVSGNTGQNQGNLPSGSALASEKTSEAAQFSQSATYLSQDIETSKHTTPTVPTMLQTPKFNPSTSMKISTDGTGEVPLLLRLRSSTGNSNVSDSAGVVLPVFNLQNSSNSFNHKWL